MKKLILVFSLFIAASLQLIQAQGVSISGRTTDGTTGEAIFNLTQSGTTVAGTVSVPGSQCLPQGDVSGSVSGTSVNLTITTNTEAVSLSAAVDNSAKTLNGTWNFTTSGSACEGDAGSFAATLTGGADIHW